MTLPDPEDHARRFARVRAAHQTELAEDYVEMIADLIAEQGEARGADLAARFGVTAATVANTLARLKRDGLVEMKRYRSIFLTGEGEAMARRSRERHHAVVAFLLALGVSQETADLDAEGLEHHLSDETLERMRAFTAARAAE
ncbi:manganese-binding transcriptional regulator MntR [Glycocaulis profundi]|nr:manganese-binding transcriptional regulator MntR [Glycocaulis profundi]